MAIAGALVLVSLVLTPLHAEATDTSTDSLARLIPSEALSSQGPEPDALAHPGDSLFDSGGRLADVVKAERALLERAWDVRIPDWQEAVAEHAAEETGAPGGADGRLRVPITSSDVDGDGHGDAVFFDIALAPNAQWTGVGLTAHSGTDGKHLWTRDFGLPDDALVLSPGDVTGDGADDVLVVVIRRSSKDEDILCPHIQLCSYRVTTSYTWEVALASGTDGSTVWERSIFGSLVLDVAYAGQGPYQEVVHSFAAETGLLDIRPSEDVDGDGLDDFTLNLHDYRGHRVFRVWAWYEDRRYDTTAELLSGDTGNTLLTTSLEDHPGAALLIPAGEATGDSRADLLWTVPTETNIPHCNTGLCPDPSSLSLRVELLDGATGETRWRSDISELPGLNDVAPLLTQRDLDGDARADVLLGIERIDGSEAVVMLSGLDGAQVWTVNSLLSDPPSAIGPVGGSPGSDVLLWEGWDPTDEEAPGVTFRIRLRRVDGASGQALFTTQHDLDDPDARSDSIFAYSAGDANADGVGDVAHAVWRHSPRSAADGTAWSLLRVESGADGTEILRLERDRKALLFRGGDFVAGGLPELFEGSTPYNDTNFRLSSIGVITGETLWSRTDVVSTALFGRLRNPAADGDTVLYARTRVIPEAPKLLSRIDVLDGTSGDHRWGIGPQV